MKQLDYGAVVRISEEAPTAFRPGSTGSIVSLFKSETEDFFRATGVPVGEIAVGVEFGDGGCVEVPFRWIELLKG
jgi:hypothetical protein